LSRHRLIHLLLLVLMLAAVSAGSADASRHIAVRDVDLANSGMLTFAAELPAAYPARACPAGTPITVECFGRTGTGIVRGLGNVQESYPYFVEDSPAGCEDNQVLVLPTTAHLTVPGRGTVELRLGGTGCLTRTPPLPLRADDTFVITGGSGRFAGASGGGTLRHLSYGPPSWRGKDTWSGTLLVPGLNFDLTPPTLGGAADKVVRAPKGMKRVRVNFNITALDDVDGPLAVSCNPKPRSRFKLGRTTVTCSALDTSGNTQTANFAVVVKRSI
jgi:hypothetical protein